MLDFGAMASWDPAHQSKRTCPGNGHKAIPFRDPVPRIGGWHEVCSMEVHLSQHPGGSTQGEVRSVVPGFVLAIRPGSAHIDLESPSVDEVLCVFIYFIAILSRVPLNQHQHEVLHPDPSHSAIRLGDGRLHLQRHGSLEGQED